MWSSDCLFFVIQFSLIMRIEIAKPALSQVRFSSLSLAFCGQKVIKEEEASCCRTDFLRILRDKDCGREKSLSISPLTSPCASSRAGNLPRRIPRRRADTLALRRMLVRGIVRRG